MNIYFEKTAYSVYEDDGLLTVVLTLDKPAITYFSVQVTDVNVTTNSKSCSMDAHAYTYICNTFTPKVIGIYSVTYLMLPSLSYCKDNIEGFHHLSMLP